MKKKLTKILKYGTLISTYGLIVSVLLQIFATFLLTQAPAWTEEASRLFFIYAMAFAAGLALKNNYYVHLDLFFDKLNPRLQRLLLFIIPLLTFALFLLMFIFSIFFVIQGHHESSPSMGLRMSFVFFSLVIMASSLMYFSFLQMKHGFKNVRR